MKYLFFSFVVFMSYFTVAQSDCKVKLKAISGTYTGDCRRGLANGNGKSVGIDQYEGEFKKGFPHGKGVYIWSNGDRYEGEFKKGLLHGRGIYIWSNGDRYEGKFKKGKKNGEGKLVIASAKDSIVTGFWKKDEYIGKYKKPYVVLRKDRSILNAKVDYLSTKGMLIEVVLVEHGIVKTSPILNFSSKVGNFGTIQRKARSAIITNVQYPFRATINGLDIEFYKSGHWKLVIEKK